MSDDLSKIKSRVQRIEIQTRKIVNEVFSGSYHSVFKGQGLDFAEVRHYAAGDDVRFIDWNVTARSGLPHVKVFQEERELNVILAVDLSASLRFAYKGRSIQDLALEVAAVMGFSAVKNQDRVGCLLFSDCIHSFVPPKRGEKHMFRILTDMFREYPAERETNLALACDYLNRVCGKKTIIVLLSDFIATGYQRSFSVLSRRHDVLPIILSDALGDELPKLGLVHFQDSESENNLYINTSDSKIRKKYTQIMASWKLELLHFFKKNRVLSVEVNSKESYIPALKNYFKLRMRLK